MQLPLDHLTGRYAFLDPASGRKQQQLKSARARSAIAVIGLDTLYRIFVLHTWADRVPPSKIIRQVLEINQRYGPIKIFGAESNAQQYLFVDRIQDEARHHGHRLNLVPIDQPSTVHKNDRIRTVIQPLIDMGRLFIQLHQVELKEELRGFPTGLTVDLVDALASAIALAPQPVPPQVQNTERQELAAYLRSTGMPPEMIADRLDALF